MKQNQTGRGFFLIKSKTICLIMLFLVVMAGNYSCTNKNPGPGKLSLNDSIKIANAVIAQDLNEFIKGQLIPYDMMAYLSLSPDQGAKLFSTGALQIKFEWNKRQDGCYGLVATGVDGNGNPVAAPAGWTWPYELPQLSGTNCIPNILRLPYRPLYLSRGNMRVLLGLPPGNGPIADKDFKPVILSPNMTTSGASDYLYYGGVNTSSFATQNLNPSPPATPAYPCRDGCD